MKTKINKSGDKSKGNSPFFPAGNSTGFLNFQAKLSVGEPGDQYETEADSIAEKIVNHTPERSQNFFAPSDSFNSQNHLQLSVQEKPLAESVTPLIQMAEKREEEKPVQKSEKKEEEKPIQKQHEEEEPIQMQKAPGQTGNRDTDTEDLIEVGQGNGQFLDGKVKSQMETGFGTSFNGVKIHTDQAAVALSDRLGAQAFTTGQDIYFNSGKYNPETKSGQKLLAHELTHTIQQGATSILNRQNTVQRWPWDSEPEPSTETDEEPLSQTPEEQLEEEKQEFRSQNYGPITYRRSEISGSGFEASYSPEREILDIEVRGKVRFKDAVEENGGTYTSPNYFMTQGGFLPIMNALPASVQSRILPNFQWTPDAQEAQLVRFTQNIEAATEIWEGTSMYFQVNETGWEDVVAFPDVNVNITQGEAVSNTTPGGLFNLFNVTDEGTSDHLQVEIVKQPSAAESANVQQIIQEFFDSFINTFEGNFASLGQSLRDLLQLLYPVDNGMIRGVRSYAGNDPGARGSNPEGFNNLMSLEGDRSDNPEDITPYVDVMFGQNESTLSETATSRLQNFLSQPIVLLNNEGRAVNVRLNGFASAEGSTRYNSSLVEERLNSVQNYISGYITNSNITTNITTSRANDADLSAESEISASPEFYDPANFRRVTVEVEREGRGGQNVLAHELGHVFGLGDEYSEVNEDYNRPAGSTATHNQLAINAGVAGGALVADDQRMMSGGNEVGAAHYSTFADALTQLTSKSWRIVY